MTCYLRMHEVAVAVRPESRGVDWTAVGALWRGATGADGRDAALGAMPVDLVDVDELPGTDLTPYTGLVLSGRADQHLLARTADRIAGLLDRGGTVVFSGQVSEAWLPGVAAYAPTPVAPAAPPALAAHPVFDGVDPDDLRGSFLYPGGHHPPPAHAEVIARRADGVAGAWVDHATTAGRMLVHSGANLLAYGTHDTSAARIVPQLVAWVAGGPR